MPSQSTRSRLYKPSEALADVGEQSSAPSSMQTATCCRSTRSTNYTYKCADCTPLTPADDASIAATGNQQVSSRSNKPRRCEQSQLQQCSDHLTRNGTWAQRTTACSAGCLAADNGWSWTQPPTAPSSSREAPPCDVPLYSRSAAIAMLRSHMWHWILVIGDSRARFFFSALVALLSGDAPGDAPPTGWPSHRIPLSGACMVGSVRDAYSRCRNLIRGGAPKLGLDRSAPHHPPRATTGDYWRVAVPPLSPCLSL